MNTHCEVVGWLLDTDTPRVLVREQNGRILAQPAGATGTFSDCAIQTGAFRKGSPIVDPDTRETVGYEIEGLSTALAGID